MAGMTDPSWGNIFSDMFSGFQAAPGQALQQIELVDKIKRERASQAAGVATGNAYEASLPTEAPMGTRDVVGPMVGDINSPIDTQGMPTATIPAPPDARAVADFNAKRALMAATGRQAALLGKTGDIPSMIAQGQVATTGLPDDQSARDRLEFQTTGKIRDPNAKPYMVVGPNGETLSIGVTQDFKNDMAGRPISVPPGASLQLSSPTPPNQTLYGDKGRMLQEFGRLSEKVNANVPLSETEIQQAHVLREALFPQTGNWQTMGGGRQQYVQNRQTPIPEYAGRLSGLVDAYRSGAHLQPPQQQQPPAPPPAGLTGTPTAVAPAPPPAPIVPPPPSVAANAPQMGQMGPGNAAELRKEITSTQQFDDYNKAVTVYNSAIQSAKAPSNQADLDIIYAIAKLFDPGSVVREGELHMASSTGTVGAQLMSMYNKTFTGKGMLSPETRIGLLEAGRNRMTQYEAAKNVIADHYTKKVIPSQGLDPNEVLPPVLPMGTFSRDELIRAASGQQTTAAPTRQRPASAILNKADNIVGVP